jgi:hypothetical protein
MNNETKQRRKHAENVFYNEVKQIPGGNDIWDAAVTDFILNVLPKNMNSFEVKHMREAVEGVFEDGNVPEITDAQYEELTNAFKKFVRSYHGKMEGGRRKTRKHKKHSKKTRKH